MVNSRLSLLPAAPSRSGAGSPDVTLAGRPFSRSYGANLPSSLTEDRSSTLRSLPLPTSGGLRYGPSCVSFRRLEAFLGSLATTSLPSPQRRLARPLGVYWGPAFPGPPPPGRDPPCPFGGLTLPAASPHRRHTPRAQDCLPARHRLRCDQPRLRSRLTLGRLPLPRNP